jgi:ADP-dependent NAD(P)H-hydrate dehydratase / NAD(P)H-hydrate epimerase
MKILLTSQVKEADAYTIANEPVSSIDLMERAAKQCSSWLTIKFTKENNFKIFAGPGNNGGDGLAIARHLLENGYQVQVFCLNSGSKVTPDFRINLEHLQSLKNEILYISGIKDVPIISKDDIVIDALFGSGLTRPLIDFPAELIEYIHKSEATVVSIDIPSGLFGEENSLKSEAIIKADYTLTFEFPFLSFFFPENAGFVGEFVVLPIGLHKDYIDKADSSYHFIEKNDIKSGFHTRKKFSHKGDYGHALLISGSLGKMGAAVLASKACLRTGVGLHTTHIPKAGNMILQTACPEAMLSLDPHDEMCTKLPDLNQYKAIGIGPGLGQNPATAALIKKLLEKTKVPLVIDADGINLIAANKEILAALPSNIVFTPHPKEFERLVGTAENHFKRNKLQLEFSKKYDAIVVLKGAYTAISCPDGFCYFNPSGNPGMATGGSGDVLTGIILSLLAQGYSPKDAAIIGVYLHGLAGDIAANQLSQEALIAGDIIDYLPTAFKNLELD